MTATVDLGHLRLSCREAALVLSLSSTIGISPQTQDDLASTSHFLTDQLTNKSAWISRGKDLRLMFNLTWHHSLAMHHLLDALRYRLINSLREAALWRQLHLQPSITIEPPLHDKHFGLVTIALAFANDESDLSKSSLHRLGEGVPYTDVQPPVGLPHVGLEQVHLSVELSREQRPQKRRRRVTRPTNCNDEEKEYLDPLNHDSDEYEDLFSIEQDATHAPTAQLESSDHAYQANFGAVDSLLDNCIDVFPARALSSTDGALNLGSSAWTVLPDTEHDNITHHVDAVMNLLDVALRSAITTLPRKLPAGITLTETTSFKRLDQVCPALWRPGYISALAARTVFHPTISHAMSHLLRHRAQSDSLKAKLEDLARQDFPEGASSEQPIRDNFVQQAINIRIWRLTQRRLHDPATSKTLKALTTTKAVMEESQDEYDSSLNHNLEATHLRAEDETEFWQDTLPYEYCDEEQDYLL